MQNLGKIRRQEELSQQNKGSSYGATRSPQPQNVKLPANFKLLDDWDGSRIVNKLIYWLSYVMCCCGSCSPFDDWGDIVNGDV